MAQNVLPSPGWALVNNNVRRDFACWINRSDDRRLRNESSAAGSCSSNAGLGSMREVRSLGISLNERSPRSASASRKVLKERFETSAMPLPQASPRRRPRASACLRLELTGWSGSNARATIRTGFCARFAVMSVSLRRVKTEL